MDHRGPCWGTSIQPIRHPVIEKYFEKLEKTGKTFLLEALGHQAVEAGLKVAWFTLEDLGVLLRRPARTTP